MAHLKRFLFFIPHLLFLGVLITGSVFAQGPTPSDDEVNAISRQLYCPVCENIPLDVCGTQACAQWRGLIRQKLAEGWTDEEIIQYFLDQYGDRVLAMPPTRGFNWLVYIVPPIAILIGAVVLFRALFSWRKPVSQQQRVEPLNSASDEYVTRIEEELKKR